MLQVTRFKRFRAYDTRTYRPFPRGFIDNIMKGLFQGLCRQWTLLCDGPWLRSNVLVSLGVYRVSFYLRIRGNRDCRRENVTRNYTVLYFAKEDFANISPVILVISLAAITHSDLTNLRSSFFFLFELGNLYLSDYLYFSYFVSC